MPPVEASATFSPVTAWKSSVAGPVPATHAPSTKFRRRRGAASVAVARGSIVVLVMALCVLSALGSRRSAVGGLFSSVVPGQVARGLLRTVRGKLAQRLAGLERAVEVRRERLVEASTVGLPGDHLIAHVLHDARRIADDDLARGDLHVRRYEA